MLTMPFWKKVKCSKKVSYALKNNDIHIYVELHFKMKEMIKLMMSSRFYSQILSYQLISDYYKVCKRIPFQKSSINLKSDENPKEDTQQDYKEFESQISQEFDMIHNDSLLLDQPTAFIEDSDIKIKGLKKEIAKEWESFKCSDEEVYNDIESLEKQNSNQSLQRNNSLKQTFGKEDENQTSSSWETKIFKELIEITSELTRVKEKLAQLEKENKKLSE